MTLRVERAEDRFHRQSLMPWWDQSRVATARVLLVGAGALGNEILKNLVLTGFSRVLVFDMDRVETTNLSRGVLFRDSDVGRSKAEVVAARAADLAPGMRVVPRVANVVHGAGLGVFLWADVVLCGVDNREARIFVNAACARFGRAWVDGAIEGLSGIVRGFDPAEGPCYECTMNETDRRLVAERRSCALLARDVVAAGSVPSTAVAASVIGALEVQEALKALHGQPGLRGEGLHVHGLWNDFERVAYPRRPDCQGHDRGGEVTRLGRRSADVTFADLLDRAEADLGPGATLDLSRDVVTGMRCPDCGDARPAGGVLGSVRERDARCPACGAHRIVDVASSVTRGGPVALDRTPADLSLPPFDVVFARRGLDSARGYLLDGDAEAVLGPLVDTWTGDAA